MLQILTATVTTRERPCQSKTVTIAAKRREHRRRLGVNLRYGPNPTVGPTVEVGCSF